MLSIVTVVKDDRLGLERTRESILSQSYEHWEHIIVAAESLDDTHLAAMTMTDSRTQVIQDRAKGIYPAMNTGWLASRMPWIVFLNGGDTLATPDSLKEAAATLETTQLDWAVFAGEIQTSDRRVHVAPSRLVGPNSFAYGRPGIMHPCTIMRRTLLQRLDGFRTDLTIAADHELILRSLIDSAPEVSGSTFAVFHLGGVSTTQIRESIRQMRKARRRVLRPAGPKLLVDDAFFAYQLTRNQIASGLRGRITTNRRERT